MHMHLRFQTRHKSQGQAAVELALLLPILFTLFFACVQVVVYIQSSAAVQYGGHVAARAFQVYGDQTLDAIDYRKVSSTSPETNSRQSIAEAAAEMAIFESLMWEQSRIKRDSSIDVMDRTYLDGNDLSYSDAPSTTSGGAVKVGLMCRNAGGCEGGQGVVVTYCAPFVLPGASILWDMAQKDYPCRATGTDKRYNGLALSYKVAYGRVPLEQ